MMTVCRYTCAIVVFLVVSLTPTSCSDIAEPAVAAEEQHAAVATEIVSTGDFSDTSNLESDDDGAQKFDS